MTREEPSDTPPLTLADIPCPNCKKQPLPPDASCCPNCKKQPLPDAFCPRLTDICHNWFVLKTQCRWQLEGTDQTCC
jgi:hypothetical protein